MGIEHVVGIKKRRGKDVHIVAHTFFIRCMQEYARCAMGAALVVVEAAGDTIAHVIAVT